MWKQSVWTSVIAASLASRYLKNGGVLTVPGAQPALAGTPGKLGWGGTCMHECICVDAFLHSSISHAYIVHECVVCVCTCAHAH